MTALKKAGLTLIVLMMVSNPGALAGDPVTKLSRGLSNMVSSPVEYANQYMKFTEEADVFSPIFKGLIYGTVAMAGRLLAGAFETATFLIPVPPNYEPLIQPETPLETNHEQLGDRQPD